MQLIFYAPPMQLISHHHINIINHQFITCTKQIGEISAHLEAGPRLVQWGKSRKKYWYS
jgi:hypothetical protein